MSRTTHGFPFRYWITSLLATILTSHLAAAQSNAPQQSGEVKASAQSSQADVRKLEVGKPIEREMRGGESHTYKIALLAGQYLNIIVDQRGIDVVAQLIAPDGKQVMEVDSPNGAQGAEPVEYIAEASGSYQVQVVSIDKSAPTGKYEIKVIALRAATDNDRVVQEASKLSQESEKLRGAGKYDQALPKAERALALREKALGLEHPDVARYLNDLADLYREKGDYAKAEPIYQRALAIREKALSPDHPDVAESLNGFAELYREKGDYAKAEPLYQRALLIFEKVFGSEHPYVAILLDNIALLYRFKGDYTKAEPLGQRALAILEKALGPQHLDVAISLNNQATLYTWMGDDAKAEALYQRSLAIREKVLGPEHPSVAGLSGNLASLYRSKGDYVKAEPLFQRALPILEKALGPQHPLVATALSNLAGLYQDKGDYVKAEPLFQRSLAILEKALGPEHSGVASALESLGSLYQDKGDYVRAEPLYQRALAISEKGGPEHPGVARALNNLATLYQYKGNYVRAEPLYQRSLAIYEKVFGPENPLVANALDNLATLFEAQNNFAKALAFKTRGLQVRERDIALNITTGSERQKLAYLWTRSGERDSTISLHTVSMPDSVEAGKLALSVILSRKGLALDAMTDSIAALRRRASPEDRALIDQLADARNQLASLTLKGPGREGSEKYKQNVKTVEDKLEQIENQISVRNAEFRAESKSASLEAVKKAIPAGAALVEFFAYRPFNTKAANREERYGELRYVAYVLRNEGEPAWVELGEAKGIDNSIGVLRQALRDPNRKDVKQQARAVEEKVFRPVRQLLGNTRRVLLSPDGALNLIPFAALVDDRDQYLLKQYSFSYLTSGRDLLRLQVKTPSKQAAIVVADPDFGGDTTACLDRKLKLSKGAVDFSRVLFCPLTGTAGEAQALQALLPDATVLVKQQATEAAVKQVSAPKILHIATHGFFLEDVLINPAAAARGLLVGTSLSGAIMKVENPLLRSGLAMAGANLHESGDDDGVLTALEVSGLDLWGTKLVVLSACDTGVGEVRNGDGVYGLRRALVLAGSESQVMSLWAVNDEATRDLMIDYYTRLQAGAGRAEALRQVQLKMLASKDRQHPYYWASFIESGEWASLDGKR